MSRVPADWQVTGTCHSRPVAGLVQCALGGRHSVADLIREGGYDWVVHCAAIRSPDVLDKDPQRAMTVNAEGARQVAVAAADAGAGIAFASTDYVFPGSTPPYAERDTTAPLNTYGESKLAGEHHVLSVPRGLVVRMPALYSLDLEAPNNLLGPTKAQLEQGKPVAADDLYVRYPGQRFSRGSQRCHRPPRAARTQLCMTVLGCNPQRRRNQHRIAEVPLIAALHPSDDFLLHTDHFGGGIDRRSTSFNGANDNKFPALDALRKLMPYLFVGCLRHAAADCRLQDASLVLYGRALEDVIAGIGYGLSFNLLFSLVRAGCMNLCMFARLGNNAIRLMAVLCGQFAVPL